MKKYILLLIAFTFMAGGVFAQTATPRVRERQVHQQKRIQEGVKSGELTKREATKLEAREAKIQRDKMKAKSDGVVTNKERAKLNREEDRTSKAIYRQKHDAQKHK